MPIFNVPGQGRVQFPEGYTKEQYAQAISKLSGEQNFQPEFSFGQRAVAPLSRTFQNIGTSLTKELPAMGLAALGFDEKAAGLLEEAQRRYAETERNAPRMYQSYEDVTGPLSALGYAYERGLEAVPYGLAMLLPGGATALGARGIATRAGAAVTEAALARGVPAASAEALGAARASQVMQRAGLAGAGAGGYALNAPETFADIYKTTGELSPGVASAAAVGQTLLDLVAPSAFLSKLGMFGTLKATEEVAKRAGFLEAAKDLSIAALKTAPKEGLTEGAQEVIKNMAVDYVRGSGELFSADRVKDYLESVISGGIGGAGLGAVGRGIQRAGMPVEAKPEVPQVETKPAETAPPVTEVQTTPPIGGVNLAAVQPTQTPPVTEAAAPAAPPVVATETAVPGEQVVTEAAPVVDQSASQTQAPVSQEVTEPQKPVIPVVEDSMYGTAVETVRRLKKASISSLQRALRIGYNRAGRLLEQMERNGVVSARQADGSRTILEEKPVQEEPQGLTVSVPPAQTVQLEGPPEFVEPPPGEGPAPVSPEDQKLIDDIANLESQAIDIDKQRQAVEKKERQATAKGQTFLNALRAAGVSDKDIADIRKTQSDKNLDKAVVSGLLDPWLGQYPSTIVDRAEQVDKQFSQNQAVEILKDRILSRNYVSDATMEELKALDLQLDDVMQMIKRYRDELEANFRAAEAADEQRVVYEQVEEAVPEGEERAAEPVEAARPTDETAAPEVTFTPETYAQQMLDNTVPDTEEAYEYFQENQEAIEQALVDLQKQTIKQARTGTEKQIADVDNVAKRNFGEVVFQDGDVALIRGYGERTGNPLYFSVIGDTVGLRDIESMPENFYTAKQKAQFLAIKQEEERKAAERHQKNPFIKFDPSGVTASSSVPDEIKNILVGWKNLLKIKPNIYLTTISEAKANASNFTGPHRKIGAPGSGTEAGWMSKMPDGNYYIIFKDNIPMTKRLEVLAHELGHIHEIEVFKNVDVATHNELIGAFNNFIRSSRGKKARDFILSYRPRKVGKTTTVTADRMEDLTNYWRSFTEWYADQIARWATTDQKPLTVVEKFFKRLADALKSFYAKVRNQKYLPNETFKQYLEKVSANLDELAPPRITNPISTKDQMTLFMRPDEGYKYDSDYVDASDQEIRYARTTAEGKTDAGSTLPPEERAQLFEDVNKLDQSPEEGMKSMDSLIKSTPSFEATKQKLGQYVNNATADNAATLLQFLNLRQLGELAKKDLPQVMEYYRVLSNMLIERDNRLTDASKLREEWDQWADKNKALAEALDKVILMARMSGIDPTIPEKEQKIKSKEFLENWNKIKGTQGQVIFEKLRDYYKDQLELKRKILTRRIMQLIPNENQRIASINELNLMFQKFVADGPYFPLSRFGEYFIAYDIKLPNGETKPYQEMFESLADLRAHEQSIQKDVASGKFINLKSGVDTKELFTKGIIQSDFINKIFANIDATDQGTLFDDSVKKRLKDDVYQSYLSVLPELSVQKHFIHAKKVAGASLDMRRAFSESAFHSAYHLARLDYGGALDKIVTDAQNLVDSKKGEGNIARDRYLGELKAQHQEFSNPQKHNPIWSKITNFAFLYYLTAPASAIGNLIQTPVIGIPTLAGEFDVSFMQASKQIFKAFGEFRAARKKGTGQFDLVAYLKSQGRNDEARLMGELEGVTNRTQTLSLAGLAERPSSLYARGFKSVLRSKSLGIMEKASLALGYGFNLAEIANRQVTALAAIRLAKQRNMSDAETVQLTRNLIDQIHFEYASETKPRFLRHPIAQVTLQFKNYAQQMTAFLIQAVRESFPSKQEMDALLLKSQDKGISQEERDAAKREHDEIARVKKAARKRLSGVLGMTALFAGYEGLPLYWVIEGTMNLLFDDEDEPYDFSLNMKVNMAEMFGDNLSRAFSKGPMSELLKIDVSRFANLNGLWFRDDAVAKDEEEWTKNVMIDMLGPAAGFVLNVAGGIKKINEGHYARGMEEMSPPVVKDFFKAFRFYHEGATTLRGDPIVPDIGLWGIFAQSIGFTPQDLQRSYEAMGEIKSIDKQLSQREQRLLSKLYLAYKSGDYEEYSDLGEQIIRYNERNPNSPIDEKKIRRSFAQRERMSERAEKGIIVSAKRPELLEKTIYLED